MAKCKDCGSIFNSKKTRYINLCSICDNNAEDIQKHLSIMRADGKTDYGIEIVRNPSPEQAAYLKSINVAHDPRTQMRFTGKGRYNDK